MVGAVTATAEAPGPLPGPSPSSPPSRRCRGAVARGLAPPARPGAPGVLPTQGSRSPLHSRAARRPGAGPSPHPREGARGWAGIRRLGGPSPVPASGLGSRGSRGSRPDLSRTRTLPPPSPLVAVRLGRPSRLRRRRPLLTAPRRCGQGA